MSTKNSHHHFLSQFYLRGFSDPAQPGRVWVYRIDSDEVQKGRVRRLGYRLHYHTFTTLAGDSDSLTLERLFSRIEDWASSITRKLQRGEVLTQEEKNHFSDFVAIMTLRPPAFRDRIEQALRESTQQMLTAIASNKKLFKRGADWLREQESFSKETPTEELRQAFLKEKYTVDVDPTWSLKAIRHAREFSALYRQMTWRFVTPPDGEEFLTSDNPVCIVAGEAHMPYSSGIVAPQAEVTFPISPRLALLASWSPVPDRYMQGSRWLVARINRRTVEAATHEVYSARKSDLIRRFVHEHLGNAAFKTYSLKGPPLDGVDPFSRPLGIATTPLRIRALPLANDLRREAILHLADS